MSGNRRKRSEIWLHFAAKGNNKAMCDHCKHELSFKTTTSNLRKHFETKHSALGLLTAEQPIQMSSVSRQPDSSAQAEAPNSTTPNEGSSSKTTVEKQTTLSSFIARHTSFARQKRLNNMLLKMIVKDTQPFFIVEDQGFQEFKTAIDPSYKLPNKKMITRELLFDCYHQEHIPKSYRSY